MAEPDLFRVPITLDEIPKFSGWPKRLLALEQFEAREKTAAEVLREFDSEKWGPLLEATRSMTSPTLADVDQACFDLDARIPFVDDGSLYLASRRAVLDRQADLFSEALAPYVDGASCLVELGAGYGSMLFRIVHRDAFAALPLYAGEYTENGRALLATLARSIGRPVEVGHCDFRAMTIAGLAIPRDALIFTSFSAHYVPQLSTDLVSFFLRLQPRAVVHFEPCYEHYDMQSLHGMMCRRYVELNDYSRNIASVVEAGRPLGISIRTRPNVFGGNPFLPFSIIEWSPQ